MTPKTSLALLGMLLPLCASARDEYTRTFDKSFTVQSGEKIWLEHKFGDIVIRARPQQEVVVHADIRISASDSDLAKQYANQVEILVQSGGELSIRTKYPDMQRSFGHRDVSFSVRYEITVPETSPLAVRNSFGAISVSGIKAPSEIHNSHGEIRFRDGRGAQRIENSFASFNVAGNAGDVTIDDTNGSVAASAITGSATIRNRFASVTVAGVSNGVSITNNNGAVSVTDSGGAGSVKNSFSSVAVRNFRGDLNITNTNGQIEALNVSGSADIRNGFGGVRFADIKGPVSISSHNARVEGSKTGGPVTIRNSFGAVVVDGVPGAIEIHNQNGEIDAYSAARGACKPITLHTSFSRLRVHLPAEPNYQVFAKTSFAHVRSDFPLTVAGMLSEGEVSGTLGSGQCEMRLSNNNGSIEILKTAQ
jgi:formylmethanofuran dehydrogenase subunit D